MAIEGLLDYGAFGEAFIYKWSMDPLNPVVVVDNTYNIDSSDVQLLLRINHKNVIKFAEIIDGFMMLEYADCGSLKQLLHGDEQREYSLRNALDWMHQAAKGLKYLHSCIYATTTYYRLTPKFLMLTNNYRYLKVIVLPSKCQNLSPTITERIMEKIDLTERSDMYSIGTTIWELLTRKKLFYNTAYTSHDIFEAVLRGEHPPISDIKISIDDCFKRLIESCWNANPDERPTIQELISTLDGILKEEINADLDQVLKANTGAIIDFADIEICKQIREDRFGVSHKAMWLGKEKTVTKFKDSTQAWTEHQPFLEQIRKNIKLNNEYLVNIYGISIGKEDTYLISDYSDCGSLHDFMYDREQRKYSVNSAIKWMMDAAEGICLLNRKRQTNMFLNYILTPYNMILFNNFKRLKISDYCSPFEASNVVDSTAEIAYIAPEVFRQNQYSETSDVYSLGIILWEVLARKKPYYELINVHPHNLVKMIKVTGMRPALSDIKKLELDSIEEFIETCWHQDQLKRPDPDLWFNYLDSHCSQINATKFIQSYEDVNYQDIELIETIGSGSFGLVYRAKWCEMVVAVKECKSIATTNFEQEIKQLARTNNQNIVKLYGSCFHENCAYLVMDYAECGSLYNYLHGDEQKEYTMARALDWMIQCVQGIQHLHSMTPKPMLHRDLKTPNLLLTDNNRILKIADFGTATDLRTLMTSEIGTVAYMAPEVLIGKNYTEKCDIYSFGIVLWEVMARRKPFHHLKNRSTPALIMQTFKGERPLVGALIPNCEELKTLIVNCWHQEPEERPI
ncbi:dual specificity protein kinase zak2-like [Drosophila hydei]|uniref:Dual specificity protein kinase zak2-like n=1 Tax=Drosophila hydei TaxID=7224 RepID=A0A6J2SXC7_DROHY|nr:dual specificity protein kinase zak2-like [Drosophila hydei]XP_030080534.1 dual specificity protein kinase zak2-like [Drosophila hydei]